MKTPFIVSVAGALGLLAASAATLDAGLIRTSGAAAVSDGKFYGYRTVSDGPGDAAFSDALALAQAEHVPLVAIWSNEDCHYCDGFAADLNDKAEEVKAWLATNRSVCVYFKDKSGDYPPTKGHKPAACYDAYNFAYATCGSRPVWPLVGFYCEKWDGTVVKWNHGDVGSKSFAWLKRNYADWCAKNGIVAESNVYFPVGTTVADRLEAVPGATTNVVVPIRRRAVRSEESYLLRATFVDGSTFETAVDFEASLDEPTEAVRVPLKDGNHEVGETVRLELLQEEQILCTSAVIFVAGSETNPKNPLWIGERDAETLAAGEWTMDRDLALAKAATTGGAMLTLLGGPLWCPDCVNNDKYLVDTDVFKSWAADNAVYCAAIDEPIFASGMMAPTLLSYESFDVSWLDGVTSGAGYLSRKMIPLTGNDGVNATAVLARNLNLATNSVANGGLCRPECLDEANTWTGKWKTGIPCFVMQNAAGEIKGRLYQFSNVSPTNDESAAAYVQRLEELRQLADDPTEEVNQHWSTATTEDCEISLGRGEDTASPGENSAISLGRGEDTASPGEAESLQVTSTISAIDASDFWRVTGRETWAKVTFAVGATSGDAESSPRQSADAISINARLNLWRVAKTTPFTSSKAEKVASATGDIAAGFSLADCEISADPDVDYFIQLEAIETSVAFALDREGSSVVAYTLTATAMQDPGTLVFAKTGATASEAEAKKTGGTQRVYVPVVRIGGASGATNMTVVVDEEATTAFADRYRLVNADGTEAVPPGVVVSWDDGDFATKSFAIDVFDDANADGTQVVVLRSGDNVFTLTITDNDKAVVGKLALSGINPATAKKGVVIAEEGSYAMLGVTRVSGASGDVSCTLKTTAGEFTEGQTLAWSSREAGEKTAILKLPYLADCKAAKATVSFASLTGITADSSAKTLAVQLVATNAPRFEVSEKVLSLVRYCLCSQEIAVVNLAEGAVVKVAKLSGTLPGGISVKVVSVGRGGDTASPGDAESSPRQVLLVTGTPTKAGAFEAVYQVSQTVNRKTTAGLTVRLAFTVIDVAALDPSAPGANPSVAKSRTFGDQTVVDAAARRLTGILSNLTIPPTGKCSAKYKCKAGTIALSSAGWSSYDPAMGELDARLVVAKKTYALDVRAYADGTVSFSLMDPDFAESELSSEVAEGWSATAPATDWLGYYTAAVDSPDAETLSGTLLAAGNPILTLKMQTASLAKKGTMSYAGVLPNGQAFSGSGTLVKSRLDTVILPVYYRTAKEFFTLAPEIKANKPERAVECGEEILPWWTHTETVAEGSFEVGYLRIAGSYYDTTLDLLETLSPTANGHDLAAAEAIDPVPVTFTSKTLTLDKTAAKASSATLSFAKATGLISGSFKTTNAAGKTVTATYKGVALPDWGDGCPNCGDIPWASGSFWYADTVPYELKGKQKSLSVKRGDVLYIESN